MYGQTHRQTIHSYRDDEEGPIVLNFRTIPGGIVALALHAEALSPSTARAEGGTSPYAPDETALRIAVLVIGLLVLALIGVTLGLLRSRAAARRMRRNEENLRVTLDSIGDAVIATDTEGSITHINPVAERLTGWSIARARGRPLSECFKIVNSRTGQAAVNPVARVLRHGETVMLANHTKLISHDGGEWQIADTAAPIRKADGSLDGVVLVFRDVTEEYRIQQELERTHRELKESETRLREAQEMASLGHWWWNVDTGEVIWSEEVYRIFQRDPEEFTPKIDSIMELSPWSEDHQRDQELIQKAITSRERGSFEQRFLRPDGSTGYYFSTFQGIYDDDGVLSAMKGTVQDISESRRARRQFEMIFDMSLDLMCIANIEDNTFVKVNPAFTRVLGYSSDELVGSSFLDLVHPDDVEATLDVVVQELRKGAEILRFENRYRTKQGDYRWLSWNSNPVPEEGVTYAVARDITEHRAAEQALRDSEERMELALQGADLGTWDWDIPSGEVSFNKRLAGMLGYEADELEPSMSILENLVHPDDLPKVKQSLNTHLKERTDSYEAEYRLRNKSGEWIWVLDKGRVTSRDENGKAVRACGTHLDITERMRAKEELLDQKLLSEEYINSLPGLFYVFDEHQRFIRWNKAWEEVTGYTESELGAMCGPDFFDGEGKQLIRERMLEVFQEGTADVEAELVTKKGRKLPYYFTGTRRLIDGRPHLVGFGMDITHRRQAEAERMELEAQLRQSQKLEAVGQLAGGVAHDFNNLLTAILGNTELCINTLSARREFEADDILPFLEQVDFAARRASTLTRQLLTFSRRDVVQLKALNLNTILADLSEMLQRLVTENIEFRLITARDLHAVKADAGQIEQVIVNLVVNAIHAMPDGGRLALETRNTILDRKNLHDHADCDPGRYVQLSVTDTGVGMDPETIERIFEPFYTTKPVDKGTGLGLATVHGIIKRAGGHIRVYSEPGQGSIFKVYLPAFAITEDPKAPTRKTETAPPACETLLVCEDDRPVRELITQSLESAGYRVIVAEGGMECLQAAPRHDGTIHLLITDVILPDMNGKALSEMLRDGRPELSTLFISGYTSNVIAHHGVLDEGVEFLEKPFTRTELLAKVSAVLESARAEVKRTDQGAIESP